MSYLRQYWVIGPADLVGVLDTGLTGRGEGGATCAGARLGLLPTPLSPPLGVTTTPLPLFFADLLSSL